MPVGSEKQRRFMAAVANNPKFAKKVNVPQSVGEEFMKKSKGYMGGGMMKRYAEGNMVEEDTIGGVGGVPGDEVTRGVPMSREDEIRMGIPNQRMMDKQFEAEGKEQESKKKMSKKPVKKMGGGKIEGYKKGGKVRGCGMAKQGVRPAKMVTMKGA